MTKIVHGPAKAVVVALFSIAATGATCTPRVEASLGETFALALGETASITSESVTVEFVAVLEDSRCPKGEQCITAGNARVSIRVQVGDGAAESVELNTARGPAEATVSGFEVRLQNVEPYPVSGKSAKAPKNLAKFLVTRI